MGYTVLLIAGLSHMPSADAGVLIGTLPALAGLFSVLVLGERPGPGLWAALGLARLGVTAVTASGAPQVGLGAALEMGAVACESVFILLNKRFGTPLPPLWQATVMTALGFLVAAPFAALEGEPVAPEALGAVVFYAPVPRVGGFLLWYAGAAGSAGPRQRSGWVRRWGLRRSGARDSHDRAFRDQASQAEACLRSLSPALRAC